MKPEDKAVGHEWTPCMKLPVVVYVRQQRPGETHVSTREGITPVKPDDLIMRGVSGEEYPIGREIFEQTYTLDTAPPAAQPAPAPGYCKHCKQYTIDEPMSAQPAAWVGLTDEDVMAEAAQEEQAHGFIQGVRWADAKLREKNGY